MPKRRRGYLPPPGSAARRPRQERFERLVERALARIPPPFVDVLDEVAIVIADEPTAEERPRTSWTRTTRSTACTKASPHGVGRGLGPAPTGSACTTAARGGLPRSARPRGRGPRDGHPRARAPPRHRRRPAPRARARVGAQTEGPGRGESAASLRRSPGRAAAARGSAAPSIRRGHPRGRRRDLGGLEGVSAVPQAAGTGPPCPGDDERPHDVGSNDSRPVQAGISDRIHGSRKLIVSWALFGGLDEVSTAASPESTTRGPRPRCHSAPGPRLHSPTGRQPAAVPRQDLHAEGLAPPRRCPEPKSPAPNPPDSDRQRRCARHEITEPGDLHVPAGEHDADPFAVADGNAARQQRAERCRPGRLHDLLGALQHEPRPARMTGRGHATTSSTYAADHREGPLACEGSGEAVGHVEGWIRTISPVARASAIALEPSGSTP